MENIMEKEPTLIEQKFEDAVKNFRQEMEKGKGKFSVCGEIERSVSGKRVLVQVYERYFLYPNISLLQVRRHITSILYTASCPPRFWESLR